MVSRFRLALPAALALKHISLMFRPKCFTISGKANFPFSARRNVFYVHTP
jgi:hypothetical protein